MLPIKDDDLKRWAVEIDEAEQFRAKAFGLFDGSAAEGVGVNLHYFEHGTNASEPQLRAPLNLAFILAKNILPVLFPAHPKTLAFPERKQDAASAPVAASITNHFLELGNVVEVGQQVTFDTWLLGYGVAKVGYISSSGTDVEVPEAEQKQRIVDRLKAQVEKSLVAMGLRKPSPPKDEPTRYVEGFTPEESPYIRLVDPFEFLVDPRARNLDTAQWVGEHYRKTLSEIKANTKYSSARLKLEGSDIDRDDIPSTQMDRFKTAELYEIHYKDPESPTGITILVLSLRERIPTALYHEHMVYEHLKGWQYEWLTFNKHQHKLYPVADLTVARPLLDRLNDTLDAVLEQVDKFINKIIANRDLVKTEAEAQLKTGEIGTVVFVDGDVNQAVKALTFDQVKQDLILLIDKLLDLVLLVTGLTKAQLLGISTAQTATEAQIGQGGSSNRRTDQGEKVLAFLDRLSGKYWAVIKQFVPLEELQLITGETLYDDETGLPKFNFLPDISDEQADELRTGEYRFRMEMTSMQRPNVEILRKQVENLIVALMNPGLHQQLAQQGKMVDVGEALRIAFRLYPELVADPNRLLRPVSPQVAQGMQGASPNGNGAPTPQRTGVGPQATNIADVISAAAGEKGQGAQLA